jgi:hypothetical protein
MMTMFFNKRRFYHQESTMKKPSITKKVKITWDSLFGSQYRKIMEFDKTILDNYCLFLVSYSKCVCYQLIQYKINRTQPA